MAMARKGKDLTTGKVTLYSDETIFGKCVATKREVWFFWYIRGACVVIHTASKWNQWWVSVYLCPFFVSDNPIEYDYFHPCLWYVFSFSFHIKKPRKEKVFTLQSEEKSFPVKHTLISFILFLLACMTSKTINRLIFLEFRIHLLIFTCVAWLQGWMSRHKTFRNNEQDCSTFSDRVPHHIQLKKCRHYFLIFCIIFSQAITITFCLRSLVQGFLVKVISFFYWTHFSSWRLEIGVQAYIFLIYTERGSSGAYPL